jgi:dienelactone hydrolase
MCHPEVPEGQQTPDVTREEVTIPLPTGELLPALRTVPEGGKGPGVVIVGDVFGRSAFYEDLAARLAVLGCSALLPEPFFRLGPLAEPNFEAAMARRQDFDEPQAVADYLTAIDWLRARTDVTGDRVGTLGFCMGGTLLLNLAAERADLASVCFYGFPGGSVPGRHGPPEKLLPPPNDRVDDIHGPLLGFWGDQDGNVGMENVNVLAEGLNSRSIDFDYEIYPGLGHGFLAQSGLDPDHEAYEPACDAWKRTVAFYRRHLLGT